ncbi:hypothetical protein GGP41_002181 [Bipolaris sorokiniana]|uniref:Uncharacterized protein n=1 Tax=Cochliobolus sativus TaxID=45130 RepID=A0A8H5ZMV9_COCSA|nr:hypothetical protein GGP41_002181 [Bipolaris sorokiniana]
MRWNKGDWSASRKLLQVPALKHEFRNVSRLLSVVLHTGIHDLLLGFFCAEFVKSSHLVSKDEAKDCTERTVFGSAIKSHSHGARVGKDLSAQTLFAPKGCLVDCSGWNLI